MTDPLDDELRALRDAWQSSRPASSHGDGLEDEDATTRAGVEWMRAAWRVQAPADHPGLLRELRRRGRRRGSPLRHLVPLAVAALVLVGLSAPLWLPSLRGVGSESPTEDTDLAPRELVHADPESPERPPGPSAESDEPFGAETEPRVVEVDDDHLVLRSGPVRLYLAMGPSTHDDTTTTETPR